MREKHPFSRMGTIFLSWRRENQKKLQAYKITLKQLFLLQKLEKEACLSPSEIADILYCDRPTASVIINNCQKNGWITKSKNAQNKKYSVIKLSKEGQSKVKDLNSKICFSEINPELFSCFSKSEKETFLSLLTKLDRHVKNHYKKGE